MRLTRTIPIERDKLTADVMEKIALGESVTAHCENIREYDNSRGNAIYVRKNRPRPDGNTYQIQTSNLNSTVTVTVTVVKPQSWLKPRNSSAGPDAPSTRRLKPTRRKAGLWSGRIKCHEAKQPSYSPIWHTLNENQDDTTTSHNGLDTKVHLCLTPVVSDT